MTCLPATIRMIAVADRGVYDRKRKYFMKSETKKDIRSQFGSRLRQYLKRSKIKQAVLAENVGVSPSAISQMLKGIMLPSQERFNAIISMLRLNTDESMELQSLLLNVRSGVSGMQSDWNRQLFNMRCYHGVTQSGLAELTGIPLRRIRELERFGGAFPSEDEKQRLEKLLTEARGGAVTGEKTASSENAGMIFAEPAFPTAGEKAVMCISAAIMAEMKPGMTLDEFLCHQCGRVVACDSAPEWKSVAAVEGFAEEFESGIDEKLRLLVVEPEEFPDARLYLCRGTNGKLYLEGSGNISKMLNLPSSGRRKANWRLAVAEFAWLPGKVFSGKDRIN